MITMAQKRSQYALAKVMNIKSDKAKFKSFVSGAPAMILQNGFGQALAFWLAKGSKANDNDNKAKSDDKHIELFDMVKEWLSQTDKECFGDCRHRSDYLRKISEMEQGDYLRSQNEILALLEWIKRYASADLFS